MKLKIVSGIGLIVSFFMPWLTYNGYQLAGFEIIKIQREALKALEGSSQDFWYLIYFLIPLFCVVMVVIEVAGHGTGPLSGLISIFTFLYMYDIVGTDLLFHFYEMIQLLSYGFYLALICSFGLLISTRKQIKMGTQQENSTDVQRHYREEMERLKRDY